MKSTFASDLEKEQKLHKLLDSCYRKGLKNYSFKRIKGHRQQMIGIDLHFTSNRSGQVFSIDEKAQLDYLNENLPTFAFELQYEKTGILKQGWLFNPHKKTDFYSLITSIYCDEPDIFTSCKITFVNRRKLIRFLSEKRLSEESLKKYLNASPNHRGKLEIDQLNARNQGYLYFSRQNKAEKPVNLILRLDFLIANGVARRFM
ncbi:hypothetical protein FGM00_17930 [Aggregatimonas sangjinii]|uniref:Uncharacterized protein n=1 Tax=Aggregatimonas sangjinii TaxID=2583587 RepID=A0A5B7SYR0_9FLAO|nr:hypothetical protein [Aggregatimonas sangjinii]QCX01900.1 hypothetical protein FGM00_17930 [Aggregatimonas sangjinii]